MRLGLGSGKSSADDSNFHIPYCVSSHPQSAKLYFYRWTGIRECSWKSLTFEVPELTGSGGEAPNSPIALVAAGALGDSLAVAHISGAMLPVGLGRNFVFTLAPFATSAQGTLTYSFLWPTGVPTSSTTRFQFSFADPSAVKGISASNILEFTAP